MHRAFATFALAVLLAVATVPLTLLGAAAPPALLAAAGSAVGSALLYRRARERYAARPYERVGVERNDDGTVGEPGAETERSRGGGVDYEPFDPGEFPWDGEFWREAERTGRRVDGGRTRGGAVTVSRRTREACEVLGVEPDADLERVREAYRERVKDAHPDHGGSSEAFERVRWAYEHLRSRAGEE